MMYQDSRDLPHLAKNDFPRKALVEAYEEVLRLGLLRIALTCLLLALIALLLK